jgi:hypothetical protein
VLQTKKASETLVCGKWRVGFCVAMVILVKACLKLQVPSLITSEEHSSIKENARIIY